MPYSKLIPSRFAAALKRQVTPPPALFHLASCLEQLIVFITLPQNYMFPGDSNIPEFSSFQLVIIVSSLSRCLVCKVMPHLLF